jgi:hypothetical protein
VYQSILYHFVGKYEKRKREQRDNKEEKYLFKNPCTGRKFGLSSRGEDSPTKRQNIDMQRLNVEYYSRSKITLIFLYIPL